MIKLDKEIIKDVGPAGIVLCDNCKKTRQIMRDLTGKNLARAVVGCKKVFLSHAEKINSGIEFSYVIRKASKDEEK